MEEASIFLLILLSLNFLKIQAVELDNISGSQFLTDEDTLVSPTKIFKLGFFRPGSSENRYLGILYNKIAIPTVVWVANRNNPLTGASPVVLKIDHPGILVLSNNMSMIWSTNATNASGNVTAKLHDTGNLVLMDKNEKVLWESFDYPTDTLLPGMKLGHDYSRGITWRLSSWKSPQDPTIGDLTWGPSTRGYPQNKLRQGANVKLRGTPWTDQRTTGASLFGKNMFTGHNVVITESVVSLIYYSDNSSLLLRVKLNSSGHVETLVWEENVKNWHLAVSLPMDICETYNICSAYGICSVNWIQQTCGCLDEKRFVPRNRKTWETADWSGGCVRRTPLDCKNGSDGFIKYSIVKFPDTEMTWFNTSMSLQECETKCLMNCSCMAYANPDGGLQGRGCLHWFGDLLDVGAHSEGNGGRVIFVRMATSELVDQSISKKKGGSKIKIILIVTVPGVILIAFIFTWLWCAHIRRNHVRSWNEEGSLHVSKNKEEDIQLPLFNFSTISIATDNFSTKNKLGEGGFGLVFKGVLKEGLEVAVKRLSKTSIQGVDEFKNEVLCISKLQHRNLVKLIGYCIQGDEKLLIYEYMPNKSLDSFIFDRNRSMLLDWKKRFNIIKGIARGLHYLHHDSRLRIIHRDLKAGNILLDANMNPKISDFGLARSFGENETQANTKRIVGTYGYMSPEYARDGLFSVKSDVFSFGVLVLEIVSGKKNRGFVHPEHDNNLIGHAWIHHKKGMSLELLDASLLESCHPPEVLRSIQVGLLCVQSNVEDRPNMSSVVMMLVGEGELPQPKKPAFFLGRDFLVADFSSVVNQQADSINGVSFTKLGGR